MTFTVKIECDNAAFDDSAPEYEIARVLRRVAEKVEAGITSGSALDTNGNRVAAFKLKGQRRDQYN